MIVVAGLAVDGPTMLMTFRRAIKRRPCMWENPGGKMEIGETEPEALKREWREELGVEVDVGQCVASARFEVEQLIVISLFHVIIRSGDPQPLDSDGLAWVRPDHAIEWMTCAPATYLFYPGILRFMVSR